MPDPNTFGGPLEIWIPTTGEWRNQALSHPYSENSRSIGAADMAYAILDDSRKRSHRSSGALAYHVLEVMHAFEKSSDLKKHVSILSKPLQTEPLPLGLSAEHRSDLNAREIAAARPSMTLSSMILRSWARAWITGVMRCWESKNKMLDGDLVTFNAQCAETIGEHSKQNQSFGRLKLLISFPIG